MDPVIVCIAKLESDYMNSGDFCENTTCLVEDFQGKWYIIET